MLPGSAASLLCALLLAACGTPSPAPVLLTLPSSVPASGPVSAPASAAATSSGAGPAPADAGLPLLAVRRVAIPEYLLARRVRYRTDASTLADWPNTFWAERVEVAVSREFVAALRPALPRWTVCESSCADRLPQATLQVELVPFDYWRPERVLKARARLTISATGQAAPRSTELSLELPAVADTPQAHAQAISEVLTRVATAAAQALQTPLNQSPK